MADSETSQAVRDLAEDEFLSDDFLRQLINVGQVDLLIGVATHNNAKTIGPILAAVQAGLLKHFPRLRAAIINPDGGSNDGTQELVAAAAIDDARWRSKVSALRTLHSITTEYAKTPARGTALRLILAAAELLQAKACAVILPESTQITPEWIATLLQPVCKEEFDLVLPVYSRHRFDGILLSNVLYPMTRALYGLRIREPFALDFAFSGELGSRFLAQNDWRDENARAASEIQFTIAAMVGRSRICQSFLGAKPRTDRQASEVVPAMRQTVGGLLSTLESTFAAWSVVQSSEPIATQGTEQLTELDPVQVNRERLRSMFSAGIAELGSVYQSILTPGTLADLERVADKDSTLPYSSELWVKTLYEFAASYRKSVIARDHIIQALVPLFRGRALTFLVENSAGTSAVVESNIEALCLEFEKQKPYLLERWNGRE
jgi:glucosylglycerate synthase